MAIIENIKIQNFNKKKPKRKIKILLSKLLDEDNQIIKSLDKSYKDSWNLKEIIKYKKFSNITLVGMGGSIMGSKSIYSFLKNKIKKNFSSLIILKIIKLKKLKKGVN